MLVHKQLQPGSEGLIKCNLSFELKTLQSGVVLDRVNFVYQKVIEIRTAQWPTVSESARIARIKPMAQLTADY